MKTEQLLADNIKKRTFYHPTLSTHTPFTVSHFILT